MNPYSLACVTHFYTKKHSLSAYEKYHTHVRDVCVCVFAIHLLRARVDKWFSGTPYAHIIRSFTPRARMCVSNENNPPSSRARIKSVCVCTRYTLTPDVCETTAIVKKIFARGWGRRDALFGTESNQARRLAMYRFNRFSVEVQSKRSLILKIDSLWRLLQRISYTQFTRIACVEPPST